MKNVNMEESIKKNEESKVNTQALSGEELVQIIYQGDVLPQDKRFTDLKEGGVFKYFFLRDLINNPKDRFYVILKVGDEIAGLSELEASPYENNVFWLKFLSIDPKHQGSGNASKLSEEVFRFVKKKGATLKSSIYSEEGLLKLKPLFKKLAEQFEVPFIDK